MTLPHLASGRRSWGRHRRNWRWSRGHVHRVVMGGVPKTTGRCGCHQKVLIAHIDSSGLLQGTWTALVSTCAIYTAHFTWGLLWLLCGKTNAEVQYLVVPCCHFVLLQRFLHNGYWSDLVRQLREKDEAPWHFSDRFCCQLPGRLLWPLVVLKGLWFGDKSDSLWWCYLHWNQFVYALNLNLGIQ